MLEPGFFLGSAFFSRMIYGILFVAVAIFLFQTGRHTSIPAIIISVVVILFGLLPVVLRLSKSAWIHIFVRYEGPCEDIPKKSR